MPIDACVSEVELTKARDVTDDVVEKVCFEGA